MDISEVAATGFTAGTADYERARPTYPSEAVDRLASELGIGPGRVVLDLAAGTGKLTRLLTATGARVIAVEPVDAMRAALIAVVPEAEALSGTAEALPLADESVDVVTVAQAFHWFRPDEALAEIARVLRPGGGLGMIWNTRDDTVPWVARVSAVIHSVADFPYETDTDWPATVGASGRFTLLKHQGFVHEHRLDAATLVARVLSTSFVASRPDDVRAATADEIRRIAADLPAEFALPYVVHAYWCHRN